MDTQPDNTRTDDVARLKRRLQREHAVRLEAEAIAERGLRDLYQRQCELETLARIAARANQDNSISDVLQFSLEEICRLHDWKAAHGYLVQVRDGKTVLVPPGIWYATDAAQFRPFARVSRHAEFEAGQGLPGRAYQTASPIWITDLMEDENFPRLGVGIACGLRSAVAFPVLSGESVMAVLEFFDTQVREPSEGALHMLAQAGTQLGRVIERQQAQEALQARAADLVKARDQAEAADRAKSAFLAAMSHELRTPLNAIIGYSEMMQFEVVGPLGDRYKEYAGDIQRSGVHLKNIINDILDLSKVSVGELSLREADVSLAALAQACVRIVSPMAAKGEVDLHCALPEDLPMLHADETRLQQAILNILSNAIKFTPPGGSVTFTMRHEADLKMEICDTGIGMTETEITEALQPFRQIDSSLSRRYEGTGLGLPLAKAFIDLHDGKLAVHSAPGAGTRVEMLLPASRCLAREIERPPERKAG